MFADAQACVYIYICACPLTCSRVCVIPCVCTAYEDPASSSDLKLKSQRALKSVLQKCTHLTALEPLVHGPSDKILKYVIQQFAKVLPNVPQARKSFMQSRGLQKVTSQHHHTRHPIQPSLFLSPDTHMRFT